MLGGASLVCSSSRMLASRAGLPLQRARSSFRKPRHVIAPRASGGFGSSTRREQDRKKVELQEEDVVGQTLEEYFLFVRRISAPDAAEEEQSGEWKALGDISVKPGCDVVAAIRTRQKEVEAASKKRLPKKSRIEIGYRLQHGPTPDDGDDVDIKILPDKLAEEEGPVPSRLRILEFDKKAGELDTQPKRKGGKGGGGASWASGPSRNNRASGAAGEYGQR